MKKTPLYNQHVQLEAKMVDFGGFNMPIQYKGISIEHQCVRNDVGIFDVSHMGEFFVQGNESTSFLNYICSNDINKIEIQKAQYNCFINNHGGIVDDLIVYRIEEKKYMLVVNATNIEKDWKWIKKNIQDFEINIELKSLNSRYFDSKISIPSSLSSIELEVNNILKKKLFRGKVDLNIKFMGLKSESISFNEKVIKKECFKYF